MAIERRSLPFGLQALRKLTFPKKLGFLEKLYGRRLSHYGVQWVECWNGVNWKLDLSEPCHRWIVYGWYEGGEGLKYAANELKNGGILIDSGANIGQWLLYLGMHTDLKSYAFEPVSSQYNWLNECVQQQTNWNVETLQSGLGAEQNTLQIQCDGARSTLHLEWFKDKSFPLETIQINRLDDFIKQRNISSIDFWKLDIEGAELSALQGAHNLFKNKIIKTLYIECHPNNFASIKEFLHDLEYGLFELKKGSLIPVNYGTIKETRDLVAKPITL